MKRYCILALASGLSLTGGPALADDLAAPTAGQQASQPAGDSGRSTGLLANSSFEFATGADYSIGRYGATLDTSVWSIPLDAKAQLGRLRLQASLPYEFIKGPGQLVGGVVILNARNNTVTSRSGVGDLNLSAAYLAVREQGALPSIELAGGVKVPTAPTSIGTGKADYALSANLYKSIAPKLTLLGSIGYSWLGSPAAYTLKNGVTASGGFNFRPVSSQNYGVSVAYRDPVAIGLTGQAVVSPYATFRFARRLGLTLYGTAGLNSASPRVGGGVRLSLFR